MPPFRQTPPHEREGEEQARIQRLWLECPRVPEVRHCGGPVGKVKQRHPCVEMRRRHCFDVLLHASPRTALLFPLLSTRRFLQQCPAVPSALPPATTCTRLPAEESKRARARRQSCIQLPNKARSGTGVQRKPHRRVRRSVRQQSQSGVTGHQIARLRPLEQC